MELNYYYSTILDDTGQQADYWREQQDGTVKWMQQDGKLVYRVWMCWKNQGSKNYWAANSAEFGWEKLS